MQKNQWIWRNSNLIILTMQETSQPEHYSIWLILPHKIFTPSREYLSH